MNIRLSHLYSKFSGMKGFWKRHPWKFYKYPFSFVQNRFLGNPSKAEIFMEKSSKPMIKAGWIFQKSVWKLKFKKNGWVFQKTILATEKIFGWVFQDSPERVEEISRNLGSLRMLNSLSMFRKGWVWYGAGWNGFWRGWKVERKKKGWIKQCFGAV